MRRTSYQKGSLRLADRKKGKVWEFLWREVQLEGQSGESTLSLESSTTFPRSRRRKPLSMQSA